MTSKAERLGSLVAAMLAGQSRSVREIV